MHKSLGDAGEAGNVFFPLDNFEGMNGMIEMKAKNGSQLGISLFKQTGHLQTRESPPTHSTWLAS